jgi:ABC-2 type transport system permease protein
MIVFGRGEPRPNGRLLIVDEDKGLAATLLSGAFTQGELGNMISVEKVANDEGRRRINKGEASALLVIPKGFSAAVLEGNRARLQLVRNPAQHILPDIIEEVLSMLADGAFYLHAVAGDQLRGISRRSAPTDANIAAMSVQFNHAFQGLRRYLSPPVIQLETQVIQEKEERPGGFAAVMLPGLLYMAVFFIAGGLATDVWRERTSGTLRRVITTPANFGGFLAGKMAAVVLVLAIVGVFGLELGHFFFDLPLINLPFAVLWMGLSGAGLYLFMMLVQTLASSERVANMLVSLVLLPLSMLGGSFFPFDMMPKGFAQIGRYTPNGWSLLQFQNILSGAVSPVAFGALMLYLAAAWILVGWRIRRTPW